MNIMNFLFVVCRGVRVVCRPLRDSSAVQTPLALEVSAGNNYQIVNTMVIKKDRFDVWI